MTRNDIKRYFNKIYSIGYCDMQYLLRYQQKIGSNSGVYGWNYNVYAVGDVAICTGYRGMPGKSVDYDIVRKYEQQAREICENWKIPYEDSKQKVNNLLYKFLEEVENA